jgi:hypothetical protein
MMNNCSHFRLDRTGVEICKTQGLKASIGGSLQKQYGESWNLDCGLIINKDE